MKKDTITISLNFLLVITLINYLAQIPYYLHNYYYPHHLIPGTRAVILLGITLIWLVFGYIAYIKKIRYGFGILLSYLIVEGLFYISSIFSGTFGHQLQNQSNIIRTVFIIGYISGLTSAYYAYKLFRWRNQGTRVVKKNAVA
jgi:hypothetical protein